MFDAEVNDVRISLRLLAGAVRDVKVARDLIASGATAADFSMPGLRAVFAAVVALAADGGGISRALIADKLERVIGTDATTQVLTSLDAADPVRPDEDVIALVAHVRRRVAARRLGDLGKRLQGVDEWADPLQTLADAQRELRDIGSGSSALSGTHIGGVVQRALTRLEQPLGCIPLGLGEIDDVLGGGAPLGRTTLYVTGSGMGKTTFGRWSALHAARAGFPVAIFGNEADRDETTHGLIEMAARIRIPNNPLDLSAEARARYADAAAEVASLPIWLEDSVTMTAESVASGVRALRQRMGVKLVVIDYVQDIMPSQGFTRDDHLSHAHKSRVIRTCAREEEVAIVGLSQIGSVGEGKDKKPDPEAVAGGRIWFRDAGAAIAIKRDAFSKDEAKQNINHVKVTKNRLRQRKIETWMRYDVPTCSFVFCDESGRDLDQGAEVIDADPWA